MPKDGWQARDSWLRDHLGQEDWESAQRSITNAHYTDPPTVMAMWDMAKRMGFTGGRVLEPSMGIGNFFGMMPADIKTRSQLAGIELDSLTGSMAKLLYPDSNIKIMGYQESKTPDNFYDLVIGNWPFENTVIADRRYNTLSPYLHDFFFLKALDQVRPGGLVIGITSNGTMDKKATKIRAALARKAELVTSIRLPSGAFQEYAGTKVVTDIVILKKREQALVTTPNEPWINSVAYKTPSGPEVFINEFYVANPGNVIGTTDYGHGTTRMQPGMIVHRPENMAERLRDAVSLVPESVFAREDRTAHLTYITNHTADREGSLTEQDGELFVVRGEHLAPAVEVLKYKVKSEATTADREQQLRALIGMRRQYAALIEAERSGNADDARKTLRKSYEAFAKQHGSLGDSFGLDYLRRMDDPFYPALAALSVNGKPAAILRESTMRGARTIENPTSQDAYVLARNKSVQPTLAEIASIAGKPEAEVREVLIKSGAVFDAPNGDVIPADIYLSGNVRHKLREAQAALNDGNTAMARNVDELKAVVPADVPYFNIESQLGATWVPAKTYGDYVAHMLNLPSANGIDVTFLNGRWKVRVPDGANRSAEAQTGFGTAHYPFSKLVNAAFTNQTVKIRRKDSDGSEYVDTEATAEANARVGDIRAKFGEWLWSDPERRVALELEYNEVRNAYATPTFDGSFLSFEGMSLSLGKGQFNLRQHQANAIWRAIVNRRSINAHEVGTGKTFTMGGIAVESRRYGIAKKPLLLAHNANSATVAHEIQMMYPAANVLYVDNMSRDTIKVKMRQIANDDWDVVVFPHSLIDSLSFKEETLMEMAKEDIRALEEEAYAAAQEDGVTITPEMLADENELKKLRSVTAKELVKARNRIIETIRKQSQQSSKEDAVPFEDLGIDMVLVDEVHEFKKPPISTRMSMKGLNTQTSKKSIALQFITRYIRTNNFGGNVHTFTGTPITNTLTEIFHQMRYVMEDELKEAGVDTWDGWFGSFAKEVQDVELSAAGEYESITRLAGFINVPELRRMIGQYMDVVFADDMPEMQPREVNGKKLTDPDITEAERAELLNGRTEDAKDRPYKKVINVTSELTPVQSRIFAQLQGYAKSWRNMSGKERKEAQAAGAPESPIITEGLANKASFDARLMEDDRWVGQEGKTQDDPGSKASKVVANVLEVYNSHEKAAQVIFSEMGFSTSTKRSAGRSPGGEKIYRTVKTFSTMRDIVERLVQGGIPREQIAIVDGSTSKEKRKEIAEAMNTLKIRVVIGSTDTLGVGVNMQRNLRAMHHIDAPYMPGELEQRNGRGLRQGNQWNTVLEYRYMTDRLDGRRWQILAIKQRFINAFMKSNSDTRVIEGDAASDEESDILQSFSEAAGDPRILIRAKLQKNVEALMRAERMHTNGVGAARQTLRLTHEEVEWNRGVLKRMTDNNLPERLRELVSSQAVDFQMSVDGTQYDTRKDAEEAITMFLRNKMRMDKSGIALGYYRDQAVTARWPALSNEPDLVVNVDGQEFASFTLRGLEQHIRNYPQRIEKLEKTVSQREASIERLEEVSKAPFSRAADLAVAQKRLDALEKDIAMNPVPPPPWLRAGAPVDSAAYRDGQEFVVTGHRWTDDGWFVLGQDDKGEMSIPYNEVTDAQGMPLYEEREFQPAEVIQKGDKAEESAATGGDGEQVSFSKAAQSAPQTPVADIRQSLNKAFGKLLNKLESKGLVTLTQTEEQAIQAAAEARAAKTGESVEDVLASIRGSVNNSEDNAGNAIDIKRSANGGIEGFFDPVSGQSFLVADNLTKDTAPGTLLHEVGIHMAADPKMKPMFDRALRLVKEGVKRGNPFILRVYNRMEAAGETSAEEAAAYIVTEYINNKQNMPVTVHGFVKDFIAKVRAWLFNNGFTAAVKAENLTMADIAAIAMANAKSIANQRQASSIQKASTNEVRENEAAYTTDLFGNPIPQARRRHANTKREINRLQGDVQPAAALQDTETTPGDYTTRTILGVEAHRQLGAGKINSFADLARATSYLYKSAVERFDAIVTDKDGNPLAVVGSFKGMINSAAIYPSVVIGEVVRVEGAANIWFAHNHPSGVSKLSQADLKITDVIASALRGTGITPRGIIAVAGDKFSSADTYGGLHDYGEAIPQSEKSISIPVVERELVAGEAGVEINSPQQATQEAKLLYGQKGSGIMLFDAQNRLSAYIPIAKNMMEGLRESGGAQAIYRAVSEANAAAAIIVHGGELSAPHPSDRSVSISQNIAKALDHIQVQVLDSIDAKTGVSQAMTTASMVAGPMYSVENSRTQTNTPAFKRWFGDSKVVDADGKPLVVYHGTGSSFDVFDKNKTGENFGDADGFFFTNNTLHDVVGAEVFEDQTSAGAYAKTSNGSANVMPVYISMQNPLIIEGDSDGAGVLSLGETKTKSLGDLVSKAVESGHDGVILRDTGAKLPSGEYETVVAAVNPEQIKSAIGNRGTFDPENPDILFSRSAVKEYTAKAVDELNKTFSAPGTLSWWHKTVGTPYNLAERYPAFKRVFDAAQGFISDVSHYANDAANLAPRLLPKLEQWKDITKQPISAADNAAIEKPINEGTTLWTRDEAGRPLLISDAENEARDLSTDEKIQRLLRKDMATAALIKMWEKTSPASFVDKVDDLYNNRLLKAGIVWTPDELRERFGLSGAATTDGAWSGQIGLYQEFRSAVDRSLDTMGRSDMLRFGGDDLKDIKDAVMDAGDIREAASIITKHLSELAKEDEDSAKRYMEVSHGVSDRMEKVLSLQREGYAPLSRFGEYTVDVTTDNGLQYFDMFESKREANKMAEAMRAEFGVGSVSQGTVPKEDFKLLAGITPESLELFGNMLGLDSQGDKARDEVFQKYIRLTKNNRSAMKRLLHRKGIAGYSQDVPRVLASFVYSNARQTAGGLNMNEMGEAISEMPKGQGQLKDSAVRLSEYIKNPQEEAQALRGLLFAQYLGGSIASAMVNMTQPVAVSFPYLSQFGGAKMAAMQLAKAAKEEALGKAAYEQDLADALAAAEEDGTVSPQEVHQLMAQASGRGSLKSGDGTTAGAALASAQNHFARLSMAWGKVFGMAEQVNRRLTFVAAYRMAKAQGIKNPAEFAKKAVVDTQFLYNKANKMEWGRGAVGGTLMTFKTYSIAYLELLHRMYTQGGPEGKKATLLALGMLMLMGGVSGLPFEEDIEDLAEGIAQKLGYNFSVKQARQEFLEDVFGATLSSFLESGISGLPGMPLDVSGRLGMGNLIPGTGVLQSKTDHTRDVLEIAGPVGDLAKRVVSGGGKVLGGDIGGVLEMSPLAVRNAAKGLDMAITGMYRDQKGYKVLEADLVESGLKAIGFQPRSVARIQEANTTNQQQKSFYAATAQDIRSEWAQGVFEKDTGKVDRARKRIVEWNKKNPDQKMLITVPSVMKRVMEMRKSKDERIAATAPKSMRAKMRRDAEELRRSLLD